MQISFIMSKRVVLPVLARTSVPMVVASRDPTKDGTQYSGHNPVD